MKTYCFAEQKIILTEEARIHPSDIGLTRGYGIFDFFRTVNYRPLFLEDYLDRFINSASHTHLPLSYSKKELTEIIGMLIDKNDLKQGGVRMVLSGGVSANHFSPAEGKLFIFCEDLLLPGEEKFRNGVKLITEEYVRPLPTIKTTNYSQAVFSSITWKEKNAEDVLYFHKGLISESSRSNIFIVQKGRLATPQSNILNGITRKNVLKLVPETEVRDITLEEVISADEVFMTSTTKRLLPVTQIDDHIIGNGKPGPLTLSVLENFKAEEAKSSN
ncbi:aminotransferase class IV [Anditalea andensis]|uniref:branched-chain-amino-acid transaminase n=1 Tax=Anditalea andensis TaxID=1048983 RepID=A0A074L1P1_9BACT|nr:aminotransferase class IV [Anditalea andensis]KEO74420.1 branched-chain amino acid aminotransferase [Anditalea andensis]